MGRDRTPVVDSPRAVAEDIARPHRWLNGQGQNRLQEARLWHAIQICFRSSSRNRSLARSPYRRLNEFRLATSARLWAAASRHQFIGLLRDSSPSVRNSSLAPWYPSPTAPKNAERLCFRARRLGAWARTQGRCFYLRLKASNLRLDDQSHQRRPCSSRSIERRSRLAPNFAQSLSIAAGAMRDQFRVQSSSSQSSSLKRSIRAILHDG